MKTRRSIPATFAVAALALAGFCAAGTAQAHVDVSVGIGLPGIAFGVPAPVYVAPPPVYVAPAPVYVPPPPVYVRPRPVVVSPYPYYGGWGGGYYYRDRGWRERHEWREHHWHRHHDDDD